MTTTVPQQVDWQHWLRRWDDQQAGYVPEREERFRAMLDVLETMLPEEFVALDLACGPGSISQRLLQRFPGARCVAADMDPVMLALGQGALGARDGRLRWVDADLGSAGWIETLAEPQVDAVLSTTALHWLPGAHLIGLYHDLGRLVRPGGVFLNGDNMGFAPAMPTFQRLAQAAEERQWSDESFAARGIETSEAWWDALAKEPSMAPLLASESNGLHRKNDLRHPFSTCMWRPCVTRASARSVRSGKPGTTACCWRCADAENQ